MKKSLTIVMIVLLVLLAVACDSNAVHKHTWDAGKQTSAPSCTKDGVMTYTCTVCGETDQRAIPATGHSHSATASPVKTAQELYCSQNGIYTYRCNVCGSEYDVIETPEAAKKEGKTVKHAVQKEWTDAADTKHNEYVSYEDLISNTKASKTNAPLLDVEKDVKYSSNIVAADMFVPASKEAVCKSCGEVLGYLNEPVLTKEKASYDNMVGTWVYTDNSEEDATVVYYIDVRESADADGALKVTAYKNSSKLEDGTWKTDAGTSLYSAVSSETAFPVCDKDYQIRALSLGQLDGESYYWISEDTSTGKYVILKSTGADDVKNGNTSAVTLSAEVTLDFVEGHNHLYGSDYSSDEAKKTWVGSDVNLRPMTHLGMNYATSTQHFLACEECGLSYYAVAHDTASSDKTTCSVCGYNANSWYGVSVKRKADPAVTDLIDRLSTDMDSDGPLNPGVPNNADKTAYLTEAKAVVESALSVLKAAGNIEDLTKTKLPALLKTTSEGGTADTSIVVAAADTTKTKVSDIPTLKEAITTALGGTNDAANSAWKSLATLATAANARTVETFYVKSGSSLNLSETTYQIFNGLEDKIAENTGWIPSDHIPMKSGAYTVLGEGTMTYAVKAVMPAN